MDAVMLVWDRVLATQPTPSGSTVISAAVLAGLLVVVRPAWEVTRHVVTIVHEGAHGVIAMLTGRRLAGIRLHSDSSGVTVSRGRSRGLGMVLTAAAGYVGPAVLGLACAWLLGQRHAVAVLWLLVASMALLLLQIRNFFGLVSVLASGLLLFVVSWHLDVDGQTVFAYVVTWFLLMAAPRTVWELQASRRGRGGGSSDADQLGRITPVPAAAWVAAFFVFTGGGLVVGASWLLS